MTAAVLALVLVLTWQGLWWASVSVSAARPSTPRVRLWRLVGFEACALPFAGAAVACSALGFGVLSPGSAHPFVLLVSVLIAVLLWRVLAPGSGLRVLGSRRFTRADAVHGGLLTAAAVCEEVLWRGCLLFGLIALGAAQPVALVLSALAFGASHYGVGGRRAAFSHVLSGLLWGGLALWSGGVFAAVVAHVAYNLCVMAERSAARAAGRIGEHA